MIPKALALLILLSTLSPFVTQLQPHVYYVGPQLLGQKIGPLNPLTPITVVAFIPSKDYQQLYLEAQMIGNGQLNLSKYQMFQKFGDTEKAEEVANYLKSHGLTVQYVTPVMVIAYGTAQNVGKAFDIDLYLYNFSGEIYYAPAETPPFIPQLDGVTIFGLTNFTKVTPMYYHLTLGYFDGDKFVPTLNGTNFHIVFQPLSLPQIAQAYNVTPGGKGVNVAVIDLYGDPTIFQDLQAFDREFGLPPANVTVVPLGPYEPELGVSSGWATETALDVETVHAMSPYAHIYLVVASSGDTLLASIPYVVSALNVSVVSMSWGIPNNLIAANGMYIYFMGLEFPNIPYIDYWFALGTALGMTFFASSGDGGAFSYTMTPFGGTSWPSSSPFVVSVGGTSLYPQLVNGSYGHPHSNVAYSYETAWSVMPFDFPIIGGGGGVSSNEPKLPFQPACVSSRATPDVSADANPFTGGVIVVNGVELLVGGTSMSAPIWAGITADIISQTHRELGWFLPTLYEIYVDPSLYSKAFHQITFGFNGAFYAHEGYNLVTGLGSPDYYYLLKSVNETLSAPRLKISVSTFAQGASLPWYGANQTFTIVAYVTGPDGEIVRSGDFNAYIYTSEGYLTEVPLHFNGTYWVGRFTALPVAPGGEWLIYVNGSADNSTGYGAALVDVGPSVAILEPVPFPYNNYLSPYFPQAVVILASNINGTPLNASQIKSSLVYNGKPVVNLTFITPPRALLGLTSSPPGLYVAYFSIITGMPQGVYTLWVNGSGFNVFTYVTVGLNLLAIAWPQVIGPEAVVSKNANITLFTSTFSTDTGLGLFSSNVTAYVYSPSGKLVKVVKLSPAPATTQFGVIYAFGLQEGNLSVDLNQSGWYRVEVIATYNSTAGVELGNYTTWFYYTPQVLNVNVKPLGKVYAGETVPVSVSITYPNGTPVSSGNFVVNIVPSNLYSSALIYEEYNDLPLAYNSTSKTWTTAVTFPSQLNESLTGIGGNTPSLSGQWYVEVIGVSPSGVADSYVPVTVEPYTFLYADVITPANLAALTTNGVLFGVASPVLTVINVSNLTIESSDLGYLELVNSSVTVINAKLSTLEAVNSDVTVVNSVFSNSPVGIIARGSKVVAVNPQLVNVSQAVQSVNSQITMYPQDQLSSLSSKTTDNTVLAVVALILGIVALIVALRKK
jgi:Predicted protease